MLNLNNRIINRNNLFQSNLYDPSVTQLGHVDRNFMKFYAILCNFTTKKALFRAYITNGADDGSLGIKLVYFIKRYIKG